MARTDVPHTAHGLLESFKSHRLSPIEVIENSISQADVLERTLNVFVTPTFEAARAAARISERRWLAGRPRPLEGVPFVLKDIVATAGIPTTGGSSIYLNNVPTTDAAVARRLVEAGGILMGKVQTFEFAFGHETNRTWGKVRNPWGLDRTTGGSSSGSAAAVAARYVPIAIGTDTGGSIREPASFCGLTAIKPTYGRVPRHGVMPLSWSLDHVGALCTDAHDVALTLQVIAGFDDRDPTCSRRPREKYSRVLGGGVQGWRIGMPDQWFWDLIAPDVEAAARSVLKEFVQLGSVIVPVSLPHVSLSDAIAWTIIAAEFAALHEDNWTRLREYDAGNVEVLPGFQFVSSSDYLRAMRLRGAVMADFQAAFSEVDLLIVPATISVAPRFGEMGAIINGEFHPYVDCLRTLFPFNVAGLPVLSLPCGFSSEAMPVGVQLVSRPFAEGVVIQAADAFQSVTEHHRMAPPIAGSQVPAALASEELGEQTYIPSQGSANRGATSMIRALAARRHLEITQEQVIAAAKLDTWLSQRQVALRAIQLPFLESNEPASPMRWIERGGSFANASARNSSKT